MVNEEAEDKVAELLDNIEAEIKEKRAARYLKIIKKGRAVIFIIALLNMVTIINGIGNYAKDHDRVKLAMGIAVFYFVLFLISRQKAYIALVVATITYFILGIYTIITEVHMYKYLFNPAVSAMQRSALIVTLLVRLFILFYLVNGTLYARKYDALYTDNE